MEEMELDVYSPAVEMKYQQALDGLAANTRYLMDFPNPVLIEGGAYPGIWLECGPLEGGSVWALFSGGGCCQPRDLLPLSAGRRLAAV